MDNGPKFPKKQASERVVSISSNKGHSSQEDEDKKRQLEESERLSQESFERARVLSETIKDISSVDYKNRQQTVQKVIRLYKESVHVNPKNAAAWLNLGVIYFEDHERQDAKHCYEKAIEINPNYAMALSNLAMVLDDLGEIKKAEKFYLRALAVDPNDNKTLYSLGMYYYSNNNKIIEGIRLLRKFISLYPHDPYIKDAEKYLKLMKERIVIESNKDAE